jgi:flagellar biosynthesis/type III secretory pathway ATPase
MELAGNLRDYIAAYRENEDLIQIGAYASGTNPRVDAAIALNGPLTQFLRQNTKEKTDFNEIVSQLSGIRDHAAAAAPGRSRG